ncbi:cell adhesion molecule 3, partial [Elysia marginata]
VDLDDELNIKQASCDCPRGLYKCSQASCDCPRGLYKCSHAVALFLYALNNVSRTDVPCSWKRKRAREEQVKSASELYPPKRPYNPLSRTVCENDRNWFFNELGNCGHFTGLHWLMQPEPATPQQQSLPLIEHALVHSKDWGDFCSEIGSLVSKVKIANIAAMTK